MHTLYMHYTYLIGGPTEWLVYGRLTRTEAQHVTRKLGIKLLRLNWTRGAK